MIKYLDYLFVLRPVLMVPVWTILLLGHHQGSRYGSLDKSLFWLFIFFTLFMGGVYLHNQLQDLETDRKNKKLFFLAEGHIPLENARKLTLLLYLFSIVPAYFLSLTIGIILTLGFLFSFFYSTPPFSWKNKPYAGFLANLLSHGSLVFIAGYCSQSNFSLKVVLLSLPYALAVGAVYINTTLPDIEGDRSIGKVTWGVKFGIFYSTLFSTVLVFFAIIMSLIFLDLPFLFSAIFSFPFYIFALLTQEVEKSVLATKVSILFLSLAAGYFYSWYLIILILCFLGIRLYYKRRFNLEYPSIF